MPLFFKGDRVTIRVQNRSYQAIMDRDYPGEHVLRTRNKILGRYYWTFEDDRQTNHPQSHLVRVPFPQEVESCPSSES